MARKKEQQAGCSVGPGGCCKIESVVAVDERGQMVLPKEVRQKAGIRPGDKLALITLEQEGKICCMALVKVEELSSMVGRFLGPMVREIEAK